MYSLRVSLSVAILEMTNATKIIDGKSESARDLFMLFS